MIAGKSLTGYASLFALNDYKKNEKITYKYFKKNMAKNPVNLDFRLKNR